MKKLHIVQLYPKEMNIYGDMGNKLVLERRLQWREIPYQVSYVGIGEPLPNDAAIVLGGGGQDAGQMLVEQDLQKKAAILKQMSADGVVMLMVCGMYQLLGHSFVTSDGSQIKGIGLLDVVTVAGDKRLIGNITIDSVWGELVGYENHSGKTKLRGGTKLLGTVKKGAGNNGDDGSEGARMLNTFGTYMHGPLLSKNPVFADALIMAALDAKGMSEVDIMPIDDEMEETAAKIATTRPR